MAPIEDPNTLLPEVDNYINSNDVMIFSKTTCPFCQKVKDLFNSLGQNYFTLELDTLENGSQMQQAMAARVGRSTVPQVFVRGQHIGGCDDTMAAHKSGKLQQCLNLPEEENYDYDLIVIGGGSGGLAASKEAAKLGKKVAVFDFVKPTPIGTTWGIGGTCVNVGCIPKKLMHHAALLGKFHEDSAKFGWETDKDQKHNWATMRENIQNYVKSLNWNYKVQLRTEKVTYLNAYAEFIDPHTVKGTDKKGKSKNYTSKHFIIATGERPNYPEDTEGAMEYGITSDDVFSLENSPGKTLVVGASYVALECAGFLKGIGLDVTVMVRSILLRGFDQDMAERIGKYMESEGVKLIRKCVPSKVEKIESAEHKLKVTAIQKIQKGEEEVEEIIVGEYDTVLFAIGRKSCTSNIGLENVGVKVSKKGKIPAIDEQTNIPNIYAIGDVLEGMPELTPAAIKAGLLLARRLYGNSKIKYDYNAVPTTVFTPLEYGCIGFSEENAIDAYGEDNIEVYHSSVNVLEWTLSRPDDNSCYAKIICLKTENERVIGFHYLGPNAGEVTQGFAVLIKFGHTKAELDEITGIHPTCAEIFTTLSVTKRSGIELKAGGC